MSEPTAEELLGPSYYLLLEGNTYEHRDAIKDSGWGFFWSSANKCWFAYPGTFGEKGFKTDDWIEDYKEKWPGVRFRLVKSTDWDPACRMAT